MKVLVGADVNEHSRRQTGEFRMKYDRKKMDALLATQGKGGAEETLVLSGFLNLPFTNLEELGMTPKRQEMFRKVLAADKGSVSYQPLRSGASDLTTTRLIPPTVSHATLSRSKMSSLPK